MINKNRMCKVFNTYFPRILYKYTVYTCFNKEVIEGEVSHFTIRIVELHSINESLGQVYCGNNLLYSFSVPMNEKGKAQGLDQVCIHVRSKLKEISQQIDRLVPLFQHSA